MTDRGYPITFLSMETVTDQFSNTVESYLVATGMDPTNFGKAVMNDPKFVFDLRNGRSPSARTIDKVRDWIVGNPSGGARSEP